VSWPSLALAIVVSIVTIGAPMSLASASGSTNAARSDLGVRNRVAGKVVVGLNDATVRLVYNGRSIDSPIIVKSGRLLVSVVQDNVANDQLSALFEDMGASLSYDPGTQTVDIMRPDIDIHFVVGSNTINVNGKRRPVDVASELRINGVFIPIGVVCEVLGANVVWRPDRKSIFIRYNPPPAPTPPPPPDITPLSAPIVPWR
jgi:hypothetical protein